MKRGHDIVFVGGNLGGSPLAVMRCSPVERIVRGSREGARLVALEYCQ